MIENFFFEIDKVFSKFGKVQSPKTLREIDLQWEIDLSIQSIWIKGNTTESIEYAPNGRIILANRRSFFKKKTELSRTQNFIRCTQLVIPPSHEILATIRRNI